MKRLLQSTLISFLFLFTFCPTQLKANLVNVFLEYTWNRLSANNFYIRFDLIKQELQANANHFSSAKFDSSQQVLLDSMNKGNEKLFTSAQPLPEIYKKIDIYFHFVAEHQYCIYPLTLIKFNSIAKKLENQPESTQTTVPFKINREELLKRMFKIEQMPANYKLVQIASSVSNDKKKKVVGKAYTSIDQLPRTRPKARAKSVKRQKRLRRTSILAPDALLNLMLRLVAPKGVITPDQFIVFRDAALLIQEAVELKAAEYLYQIDPSNNFIFKKRTN